jgi:hypothetical protein
MSSSRLSFDIPLDGSGIAEDHSIALARPQPAAKLWLDARRGIGFDPARKRKRQEATQ